MKPRTRACCWLLVALLLCPCAGLAAIGDSGRVPENPFDGFESGQNWFGADFDYDVTNEAEMWELLQRPITVLDIGETDALYPLQTPGGEKVNQDKLGGYINGASAGVHVLGQDEDGWTLIEGLDYYDRLIRGYVKTKYLKTYTPNEHYGLVIDKLTQRMYVFIDGKLWSSCAVSTGLSNPEQPYNETASGEYVLISWSGGFESEGMYCDMAIRFNSGDKIHLVPYVLLGDGTKRYDKWEQALGTKASHGCIRTQRKPNDDGLCMKWLWDNLRIGTKVVIFDDDGRALPYPDDATPLYYNTDGGSSYHMSDHCSGVKEEYYPLAGFTYGELETAPYSKLARCQFCCPPLRKADIDAQNEARGQQTPNKPDNATVQVTVIPPPSDEDIIDPLEFLGVDSLEEAGFAD